MKSCAFGSHTGRWTRRYWKRRKTLVSYPSLIITFIIQLTPKERNWLPWPVGWHRYRWKWQGCIADINVAPHKTDETILQAARQKNMSVPKERPSEPTQYYSLDVFQETVGIPVAEEIHDGGCNRAEQKEKHQTFPRKEKVSSSIYQYLKESHRTAAKKKMKNQIADKMKKASAY